MSISVTVSGQDSISVVSSQPLTDTVEISSISALDPLKTATGLLSTATGNLDSKITTVSGLIVSNDTDLTALNTATGLLNTATGVLNTATGLLVQKSETGVLLTSGEIQTNIDAAVANLVDSAPATLNTLNELAAALGDDQNFSTTTATSLGNLNTATGVLNTNVTALQGVTGSFAQTGADVNFQNLTVNNNISLSGNIIDLDGNEIIQIQTNDVIFNGKHIQAGFGVGVRHDRGDVRGMDQGSTFSDLGLFCNSVEALSIQTDGDVIVNTGNLGIGTTSPQANLHVVEGEGTVPTFGSEVGVFQNNNNTSDNVGIGLIAGTSGNAFIHFGDADSNNQGQITFKNTSNDLAFKTNATERFTILSGGNVGIGTTSPESLLTIKDEVGGKSLLIEGAGGNNVAVLGTVSGFTNRAELLLKDGAGAADVIKLSSRSSINNFVHNGGNFGIGTTAPTAKLHVAGTTLLSGDVSITGNTIITGNIGIGTTSPSDELTVRGVQFNKTHISIGDNIDRLRLGYLHGSALDSSITAAQIGSSASRELKIAAPSNNSSSIKFYTNTGNGSPIQRMVINNSGDVGIGTTTPKSTLHVNGDTILSGNLTITGTNVVAKNLNVEGTIISESGLGVGTTSPAAKLHVGGITLLSGDVSVTGNIKTTGNITSNGIIKAINSDASVAQLEVGRNNSELIEMKVSDSNCFITANQDSDSNGSHSFVLDRVFAGSGPSNFVIRKNGSNQARIDTSGNMCIGTGVPATKLHVEGNITGSTISGTSLFVTDGVGIGTASITAGKILDVNGDVKATSIEAQEINLKEADGYFIEDKQFAKFENNTLKFGDHDGEGFTTDIFGNGAIPMIRITGDGSQAANTFLGIGTTAPQAKLHVNGDTILSGGLIVNGDVKFGTGTAIGPLHLFDTGETDATLARFENTSSTSADHDANIQIISKGAGESTIHFINKDNTHTNGYQIGHGDAFGEALFFLNKHDNRTDMVISQAGNVGIGEASPNASLHVDGDTILSGHVGIGKDPQFPLDINGTNSTTGSTIRIGQNDGGTAIRIGVGGGSSDVVLMRVDGKDDNHDGTSDSANFGFSMKYMGSLSANANALRIISDNQQGTAVNALNILQDGSIGLNTVSPAARLHVNGNTILSGNLDISGSITPAKDVAFDIGSPTKRFKDLYLSGDSIFLGDTKLSISGDELQTRRGGVVRRAPLRDNLNQTRNLIVTGNSVLGKCSLSANSFVTETGDFTLGLNHRGATVLLQNPAAITITCPALVPGHVTTFIAETQHIASFATGVGMSGLNSFNGASEMAGIFAQAQIIYKSLSGAFLGGNIV